MFTITHRQEDLVARVMARVCRVLHPWHLWRGGGVFRHEKDGTGVWIEIDDEAVTVSAARLLGTFSSLVAAIAIPRHPAER